MQSERYTQTSKSKTALPLNYGGDGRYYYVLCGGTSPAKVCVIDTTLVTAANYLGGGAWTSNPEIAVITLSAGTCYAINYIPTTKEVWVACVTNTKVIDANPNSGTFNTEIATFTILGSGVGASTMAMAWDAWSQTLIVNANQALFQIRSHRELHAASSSSGVESNRMGKFFNPLGLTIFCNEGLGASMIDSAEILNNFGIQKRNFVNQSGGGNSAAWSSEKYIYFAVNGSVQVFSPAFVLLATISITAARVARPGFSEKNNRLIFGSIFSNTISFIEETTLTGGGNLTKGYIHASEDGTREFVCVDDVAIAIPGAFAAPSTTLGHLHGIDMAAKSYIGYIPITGLLTSYSANNSYNVQNSCKNRIEV